VIRTLIKARVYVLTFARHTTQVFQILDLTLFGVLKRRPRYELAFDDAKPTADFIMKVYDDSRQILVSPNV
jgi:hypothetical protein